VVLMGRRKRVVMPRGKIWNHEICLSLRQFANKYVIRALGAIVVTVPTCWYILQGAEESHDDGDHGKSHGHKEETKEQPKTESEEKPQEQPKAEPEEKPQEQPKAEPEEKPQEQPKAESEEKPQEDKKDDAAESKEAAESGEGESKDEVFEDKSLNYQIGR
jgi:type IV secretory pathway VirB10-like protein